MSSIRKKIAYSLNILLAVTLSCVACKKGNNQPIATPINDSLKKAFYYRTGSYWIYKDSVSSRMDSFVVVSTDSFSAEMQLNSTKPSLQQRINILVNEYNGLGGEIFNWQWSLIGSDVYITLFPGPFFHYPLIARMSFPFEGDEGLITNIFPSYLVAGNNFNNVAEIDHINNDTILQKSPYFLTNNRTYNDLIYINVDTGIIKMTITNSPDSINHIWELQRCQIIR